MLAALVVALVALGVPAVLTGTGQRRRGSGLAVALVAGAFFPVTWVVWYVADEHPYGVS